MKPTLRLACLFITFVSILILATPACKKHDIAINDINTNATVLDTGSPAADGCGWLVQIEGTNDRYSPANLPDSYKTANLKVYISYKLLSTRFQCGMVPNNGFVQIQLDAIKKQ